FQKLEELLAGEITTLAYPPAALFALCTAFVAYNIMKCIIYPSRPHNPIKQEKYLLTILPMRFLRVIADWIYTHYTLNFGFRFKLNSP
ncbi:MAG: hypothetical protein LBE18_08520, partial [Planctomycetaceae bacterium]|nr:hypothetical protein [Planctomycetaceae bacterium]